MVTPVAKESKCFGYAHTRAANASSHVIKSSDLAGVVTPDR